MPLGAKQKGCIDILNCHVVPVGGTVRGQQWVFRIGTPTQTIDIAAPSEVEMQDWIQKIRDAALSASELVSAFDRALTKQKKLIFLPAIDQARKEEGERSQSCQGVVKSHYLLPRRSFQP